jgi:hypothetical protein
VPLENREGAGVALQVDYIGGTKLDSEFIFDGHDQLQVRYGIPLPHGAAFSG